MKNNKRSLLVLKFLTEQTDENHLATIAQINDYLQQYGLDANRETISDCIKELQEVGYDIFCVRSTQNRYYMRERPFSLAEVKLLVDAVQSSRFVSKEQSIELVSKLADLVGSHKSEILKRHLYIDSRAKTDNTDIMEYVDHAKAFAHGFLTVDHDAVGIMYHAVADCIGNQGISNLVAPSRNIELGAKDIAQETNTNESYVKRADLYARGVDIAEATIPGMKDEILSGRLSATAEEVMSMAKMSPEEIKKLAEDLRLPKRERKEKREKSQPIEESILDSMLGAVNQFVGTCGNYLVRFPKLLEDAYLFLYNSSRFMDAKNDSMTELSYGT